MKLISKGYLHQIKLIRFPGTFDLKVSTYLDLIRQQRVPLKDNAKSISKQKRPKIKIINHDLVYEIRFIL